MTADSTNLAPNSPAAAPAPRGKALVVAALLLSLVGLGVAAELTDIHYLTHTDPAFHSVCAMSETVNCETVAESAYSVFLGLPISVWGLFAYAAMAVLAAWGLAPRRRSPTWPRGALLCLFAGALVGSGILAFISFFLIDALCLFCLALYIVNAALTGIGVALVLRGGRGPAKLIADDARALLRRPVPVLLFVAAMGGGVAAAELLVPAYWVHLGWRDLPELPTGVDGDGHHWIGAEKPLVTVLEFSDYQCPHCRRAHRNIRQMAAKYADTVRLVHRHQPLDEACNASVQRAFHERACELSFAAECAGEQGKFWAMNDALFSLQDEVPAGEIDLNVVAVEIGLDRSRFMGCLRAKKPLPHIEKDIAEAERRRVVGTPTYFIGAQPYPGGFPESVLSAAVSHARKSGERF
jgi:protein-disulfide isomerase/uncharacterized membrane protein